MEPLFSRKSALFLALGVFALLFGVAQSASAVDCQDWTFFPSLWNKDPSCNETLEYNDIGGSNLSTCEYRVVSVNDAGGFEQTLPWTSAGNCNGATPPWTSPVFSISIGSVGYCKYEGVFRCIVYWRAQDGAGNKSTDYDGDGVTGPVYNIDYTSPTVTTNQKAGQADPTAASPIEFTAVFSESVSGFASSDVSITGTAGGTKTVTVTGSGTTYNVAVSGMTSTGTVIATIPAGGATDAAGNGNAASTSTDNTVTYDISPPTVTSVSSTVANGNYTVDAGIPVTVTFSKSVTVTGTPQLTLATGGAGTAVNYTSGSPGTVLTFQYTVALGHNSSDLDYVNTSSLALNGGTIKDTLGNDVVLILTTPGFANSLGANKAIVIDTIAPTVTDFRINDTPCIGGGCPAVLDKDALNIEWTAPDNAGGSGIWKHEIWRAQDTDGDGSPNWPGTPQVASATSPYIAENPAEGTYWYGIHTLDNANNCISEAGGHCGGTSSDSESRTVRGPIKVIMDKTAPGAPGTPSTSNPTNDTTPTWTWTASTGSPSSYDVQWATNLAFTQNLGTGTSGTNSFTHSSALTENTWYFKAKARDAAGNESGFSGSGTVVIDTTPPLQPTCTPAGGTFQNKANNVTCSDIEAGVTIRYTLDGSDPTTSSTLYSSPFDITSSAILEVAAWDPAGNRSAAPDNSYSFTITHNQNPTIQGNPTDSPDPIKANAQITFSVNWNDPDAGDLTKLHICKTNAISGQKCSGGSWCDSAAFFSTSPASCSGTSPTYSWPQNYYAFVCDDENACSASKSGTFLVDTKAPTITTFTITPQSPSWANNASPNITVTWNVSDQGSSHLDKVRVYRAPFDSIDPDRCDDTNKLGCVWTPVGSDVAAPPNSDNWNCPSCVTDTPGSGTWWYGMHVWDKAQNETVEPTPPGPKKALVDTNEPNSQIQSPASSSWFSNDFTLDTLDEDLFSGLDTAQCQYKIIPFEDTNGDGIADTERTSSGWLSRTCNAPPNSPVTSITVGTTDYCKYQAKSSCWVYIRSKDVAGNLHTPTQPAGSVKLYNIDWTQPEPGKLYLTANEGDQTYPIQVQLDQSNTYKVHVTDNLKVSGCSLYIDGIDQEAMTPTVPGCEKDCTFTGDFTFTGTGTYHNNYAICKDAADNSTSGTSVNVEVKTLSVGLSVVPSPGGSVNTLFDLTANTAGSTMTGDTTYGFDCRIDTGDCTADGNFADCDLSITTPTGVTSHTADNLCQYPVTAGTYTAKVAIQRGVGTAQDTASIGPITTNSVPEAAITCDPASCVVYDTEILTLMNASSDPDGAGDITKSVWDILNFGAGAELTCPPGPALCNYTIQPMPTGDYTAQLSVEDLQGDTDNAQQPFTLKRDIVVNFACSLDGSTWQACSTLQSSQGEVVQFKDASIPSEGASIITSWIWTFQGGIPASANTGTTSTIFQSSGSKIVTLQVTDNGGRVRTGTQTINLTIPFPEWQEISPF